MLPALLGLASSAYLAFYRAVAPSYDVFSFVQFLIVFALLLVPTVLMGNTFGAVTGVAVAGYALIPVLGNRSMIVAANGVSRNLTVFRVDAFGS